MKNCIIGPIMKLCAVSSAVFNSGSGSFVCCVHHPYCTAYMLMRCYLIYIICFATMTATLTLFSFLFFCTRMCDCFYCVDDCYNIHMHDMIFEQLCKYVKMFYIFCPIRHVMALLLQFVVLDYASCTRNVCELFQFIILFDSRVALCFLKAKDFQLLRVCFVWISRYQQSKISREHLFFRCISISFNVQKIVSEKRDIIRVFYFLSINFVLLRLPFRNLSSKMNYNEIYRINISILK